MSYNFTCHIIYRHSQHNKQIIGEISKRGGFFRVEYIEELPADPIRTKMAINSLASRLYSCDPQDEPSLIHFIRREANEVRLSLPLEENL